MSTASTAEPRSVHVCPACGKPVDPLRAGHVAIVDGRFAYYCDAVCKRAHAGGAVSGA